MQHGVLDHPGVPHVRSAQLPQTLQGLLVDIAELPDSVFFLRTKWGVFGLEITEQPGKHLVNHHFLAIFCVVDQQIGVLLSQGLKLFLVIAGFVHSGLRGTVGQADGDGGQNKREKPTFYHKRERFLAKENYF